MPEFYCIYSGELHDVAERSDEHIVPYSLGGSNQLVTRDVARIPNNEVGRTADSRLINNFFMAYERWQRGIASEDGSIPSVEFRGKVKIADEWSKATFRINPDRTTELVVPPSVESDWGELRFKISCNPDDLPGIAGNIEKKGAKRGLSFRLLEHAESTREVTIPEPQMAAGFSFEFDTMALGFVKMALATGHHVLGYTWSQSVHADRLRGALHDAVDDVDWAKHAIHGSIWPDASASLDQVLSAGPDRHVLFVSNNNPLAFYALLFGKYNGLVQLAPGVWNGPGLSPGEGRVIVIDTATRRVFEFRFGEYVHPRTARTLPFTI